ELLLYKIKKIMKKYIYKNDLELVEVIYNCFNGNIFYEYFEGLRFLDYILKIYRRNILMFFMKKQNYKINNDDLINILYHIYLNKDFINFVTVLNNIDTNIKNNEG